MELKEGMYVRTLKGIAKIVGRKLDPNDYYFQCWITDRFLCICDDTEYLCDSDVLKASYNIIDLIEIGDYVNGDLVLFAGATVWDNDGNVLDKRVHINHIGNDLWIAEKLIKSIVTKEQFESICYKVEE